MKKFKKGTYRIALRKDFIVAITEKVGTLGVPDDVEVHEFKTAKELIEFVYEKKLDISRFFTLDEDFEFSEVKSKDIISRLVLGIYKKLRKDDLKYSKKKGYEVRQKDLSDNDIGEQSDKLSTEVREFTRKQGNKGKGVSKDK